MITLQNFDLLRQSIAKLRGNYEDQNVYRELDKLSNALKQFVDKHKIEASYRLAVPQKPDKNNIVQAGIELGKIRLPKTLRTFLLSKVKADANEQVSTNRLFAMLLKHQRFNAVLVHRRIRILIDAK